MDSRKRGRVGPSPFNNSPPEEAPVVRTEAYSKYEAAQQALTAAYQHLTQSTNNQLGMPSHLRSVAAEFAAVKEKVGELETIAYNMASMYEPRNNTFGEFDASGGRRRKHKTRKANYRRRV